MTENDHVASPPWGLVLRLVVSGATTVLLTAGALVFTMGALVLLNMDTEISGLAQPFGRFFGTLASWLTPLLFGYFVVTVFLPRFAPMRRLLIFLAVFGVGLGATLVEQPAVLNMSPPSVGAPAGK